MSDILYIVLKEGMEWDDIVILTNREEAIKTSIKYPDTRVELFYFNKLINKTNLKFSQQ